MSKQNIKIGLDAMGGDFAPLEVILGAQLAIEKFRDIEIHLFGEQNSIDAVFPNSFNSKRLKVIPTGDSISMSESPTRSVATKKESSINVGLNSLSKGEIDVYISAGNTGAVLVSSTFQLGLIDGLQRPVLSTLIPKLNGETCLLLDVGANADCKPEHLHQFALLGNKLMKSVYNLVRPAVGLLNIGEEQDKGNQLTKETHKLLSSDTSLNFIGNIEGRELFNSKAHIIVCDGFTGNIILKTAEGLGQAFLDKGIKDDYLINFDYTKHGGTPLLGLKKPVIIAHGISKKETVENMVKLAIDVVNSNLFEKIEVTL